MTRERAARLAWWPAAAAAAAACWIAGDTVAVAFRSLLRIPIFEHWFMLDRYLAARPGLSGFLAYLWEQFDVDHSPLIKVWLLADLTLARGRGWLVLAAQFACLAGCAGVWTAAYARADRRGPARLAFAALAAAGLFSARGWMALWPFQAWLPILFLSSAAIFLLERSPAGALACAVAATGYRTAAMPIWPVLVAMAFVAGASRRARLGTLGVAAAVVFLELRGYTIAYSPTPGLTPLRDLAFLGSFLLQPAVSLPPDRLLLCAAAAIPALAGAGALGWMFVRSLRSGRRREAGFFGWALGWLLATAAAIAVGRSSGLAVAGSSRYYPAQILVWTCAAALATFSSVPPVPDWLEPLTMPVAAVAVVFGLIVPRQAQGARALASVNEERNRAALAVAIGAPVDLAEIIGAEPDQFAHVLPFLRRERLFVFSEPLASYRDRPFTDLFSAAAPGACSGSFDSLEPDPPGNYWKAAGSGSYEGRPIREVVIVDERGVISGLARSFLDLPAGSWSGYVESGPSRALRAFGVTAEGRACLLGGRSTRGK